MVVYFPLLLTMLRTYLTAELPWTFPTLAAPNVPEWPLLQFNPDLALEAEMRGSGS